ncbi:MAG: MBL fold metallo-hydrolase, partial [Gammaproteobacteria bacterium]|nr:MBL fold metallo-hydrolase [Gammaproteobacteria bacterium]
MKIKHWGAVKGVTGSCHQLFINHDNSVLIDCGLFQGADSSISKKGIDFDIVNVQALIITHCHIDHVGRIPYLLAAGFNGPIYATEATAILLPLVIKDALKVGVTRDKRLIDAYLAKLKSLLKPIKYNCWFDLPLTSASARARFQPAGHILGSAYIEIDIPQKPDSHRVVFSGDLGAPHTPLLPDPQSPSRADTLIIESTYGDKLHQGRKERQKALKTVI